MTRIQGELASAIYDDDFRRFVEILRDPTYRPSTAELNLAYALGSFAVEDGDDDLDRRARLQNCYIALRRHFAPDEAATRAKAQTKWPHNRPVKLPIDSKRVRAHARKIKHLDDFRGR